MKDLKFHRNYGFGTFSKKSWKTPKTGKAGLGGFLSFQRATPNFENRVYFPIILLLLLSYDRHEKTSKNVVWSLLKQVLTSSCSNIFHTKGLISPKPNRLEINILRDISKPPFAWRQTIRFSIKECVKPRNSNLICSRKMKSHAHRCYNVHLKEDLLIPGK